MVTTTLAELSPSALEKLADEELRSLVRRAARELGSRSPLEAVETLAAAMASIDWTREAASRWTTWSQADSTEPQAQTSLPARSGVLHRTMNAIQEDLPGPRWKALFDATWPSYRAWYLKDGDDARPDLSTARDKLVSYMPELVPTWERLVALTGGDETAARMLTMWDTPAFLPACSQAVLGGDQPGLVRNYDYHPDLFEWVTCTTAFTGRKVMGTSDCLWGLLDGMNEDGLMVSLTFGGRRGSGEGFAIPLVVRYLLEVASTVDEAKARLRGLPVAMSYNLTIADRSGAVVTAFVAPGAEPEYVDTPVATNHRGTVPEDPEHAARFRSVERQQHLIAAVDARPSCDGLAQQFLADPLYARNYAGGFGTLYTAVYRPDLGTLDYLWPDTSFSRTFDSPDVTVSVTLHEGSST